jgi:hypothetical protein
LSFCLFLIFFQIKKGKEIHQIKAKILRTDEQSVFYQVKTTTKARKTHLKEGYESPAKQTTKNNVDLLARLHKKLMK